MAVGGQALSVGTPNGYARFYHLDGFLLGAGVHARKLPPRRQSLQARVSSFLLLLDFALSRTPVISYHVSVSFGWGGGLDYLHIWFNVSALLEQQALLA